MKLFAVTKNGRRGEWFDDCSQFELGEPSRYFLAHYPDYKVHLKAKCFNSDVEPEHFGEDAICFCSGKVGEQWMWHMLLGENGVERGLREGWLSDPRAPRIQPESAPQPLSWWQRFVQRFR